MNDLNAASSTKLTFDLPTTVDLSERIWNLHRTITDPTVKRHKVKDAKRALLGELIVQNELRNILAPPISKRARASSSSFRANHFRQRSLDGFSRGGRTSNVRHHLFPANEVP